MSDFYSQFGLDEVNYFLDFIKTHIGEYHINELTNGYCGDIPSINGAHPLAMEYGNMLSAAVAGSENYTSVLPAIGVEFIDDNENEPQVLGAGRQIIEVTQDFINAVEAIPLEKRIGNGVLMSKTVLDNIKAAKTTKGDEALYGRMDRYIQAQSLNISVWSDHIDVTRIVYLVVRSLLKRAKRDLSRNAKNLRVSGSGAIYNYEFGKTLFGAEFNVTLLQMMQNVEVDGSTLQTIKKIEEVEQTGLESINTPGNTYKPKGR